MAELVSDGCECPGCPSVNTYTHGLCAWCIEMCGPTHVEFEEETVKHQTIVLVVEYEPDESKPAYRTKDPDDWDYDTLLDTRARVVASWPTFPDELTTAFGSGESGVGTVDDGPDDSERCPACGEFPDYCQGHGEIGDPAGRAILDKHDQGDHADCWHTMADTPPTP